MPGDPEPPKPQGWIKHQRFPGRFGYQGSGDATDEECNAMYPEYTHLANPAYRRLMGDYLACTTLFLHQFAYRQQLEA